MKLVPALLGLSLAACARVAPGEHAAPPGATSPAASPSMDSPIIPVRDPARASPRAPAGPSVGSSSSPSSSPSSGPSSGAAGSSPGPSPAGSPGRRVVVATPGGELCVLSAEDGSWRSQTGTGGVAGAVDVLASRSDQGSLLTIEPGEQEPGQIGHYRLDGDALQLEETEPFDALDGRLLRADSLVAGAAITEGALLFAQGGVESGGGAWPFFFSMAASARPDGSLRVVTLGPGDPGIERREGLLSPAGLTPLSPPAGRQIVPGACAALFESGDAIGMASSDGQTLRVEDPSGAATTFAAPGACVEAALGAGEAAVILTGPVPTLWWLDAAGASSVVLGDPSLDAAWLPRRLAYDAARHRVWAIVGARLFAVDPTGDGLQIAVAEAGCPAASVTLVEGG